MDTVEIQGLIHKIYQGNKNTIITIFVEGIKNNFPQIVFGNNEQLNKFKEGDFVHIDGSLKSRGIVDKSGKKYHEQFIKGLDISYVKEKEKDISFENDEKREEEREFINNVIINGVIMASNSNYGMVNLIIKPDNEKFNVIVSKYDEKADEILEQCKVDYRISVKCEIQTVRKEINGKIKFFENTIVKKLDTRKQKEKE